MGGNGLVQDHELLQGKHHKPPPNKKNPPPPTPPQKNPKKKKKNPKKKKPPPHQTTPIEESRESPEVLTVIDLREPCTLELGSKNRDGVESSAEATIMWVRSTRRRSPRVGSTGTGGRERAKRALDNPSDQLGGGGQAILGILVSTEGIKPICPLQAEREKEKLVPED